MQVMPLLRHILENATDRPHALLRAKALECISLVGMAVGRARFRDDAARVMQLMQALQAWPPGACWRHVSQQQLSPVVVLGNSVVVLRNT